MLYRPSSLWSDRDRSKFASQSRLAFGPDSVRQPSLEYTFRAFGMSLAEAVAPCTALLVSERLYFGASTVHTDGACRIEGAVVWLEAKDLVSSGR